MPERAVTIALATALQESALRNLDHGDRDSLGLFQQRPSQGWGSPAQVTDPNYSARIFYDRLLQVPDWEDQPVTVAAQTVQRSAFPSAYAKWEGLAADLVEQLGDVTDPTGCGSGSAELPAGVARAAIEFALGEVGKPYVWGATGPDSYDCSGLTQAAWKAAGVSLPRTTYDQVNAGTTVSLTDAQPGDLIFFYDDISHVGIYIGNGMMIHAPKPGAYVREESIYYAGSSIIHSVVRPA